MAAAAEQTPEEVLTEKLKERLAAEFVSAKDLSDGCGSKYQCVIVSTQFDGKALLASSPSRPPPLVPSQPEGFAAACRSGTAWSTRR